MTSFFNNEVIERSISFKNIAVQFLYLFKVLAGVAILAIRNVSRFIYNSILITSLHLTLNVMYYLLVIVRFIVGLIFDPFNLIIKIIDYNTRQFLNFWLRLLFNINRIEDIITVEYGLIHFKIFVEWVRFINVMFITSFILGILTYLIFVRTIYWMTTIGKSDPQKGSTYTKNLERHSYLGNLGNVDHDGKRNLSLLNEYIFEQRKQQQETEEGHLSGDTEDVEGIPAHDLDASSTASYNTLTEGANPQNHDIFPTEEEEEEIYNFETLNSLSTSSSFTTTPYKEQQQYLHTNTPSTSTSSPLTKAFRSRVSSLNTNDTMRSNGPSTSPSSTINSSIFSTVGIAGSTTISSATTNLNDNDVDTGSIRNKPITTIEEDEEEA